MNTVRGGKNLIGANGGLLFSNYKDCSIRSRRSSKGSPTLFKGDCYGRI